MGKNIVTLDNVSWRQKSQNILRDVSWNIEQGQHWALIGNNGSGKTSLLNIINGYVWPSSGTVTVLDYRFGSASLHEMRQSLGWVSSSFAEKQQSGHPEDTVREVVVSGRYASIGIYQDVSDEDWQATDEALDRFHCLHLADRQFQSLSQGEKQRIILARALVRQPRLLILDEPCTGLDVPAREELLHALQETCATRTDFALIYVTHHIEEIIPAISHALTLANGVVVGEGIKEDVLSDDVLTKTFGLPVHVAWADERPWLQVKSQAL